MTPISAIAPLVFVIMLSVLREGVEDVKRHQSDSYMNGSECVIYRNNKWERRKWCDVIVGDLLLSREDEIIAADAVIIASSLPTGQCFIETSSLDGEKNLKPRAAFTETQASLHTTLSEPTDILTAILPSYKGQITCTPPNAMLHYFEGCLNLSAEGGDKIQMNIKNLLLRGSRLKNGSWAVGIVVSTGKDTKIMKNANQGTNKLTSVDDRLNK